MSPKKHFSERCASWLYQINVLLGFLPPSPPKTAKTLKVPIDFAKIHVYSMIVLTSLLFGYSFSQGSNGDDIGSNLATHVVLTHLSFILMYISLLATYIHVRIQNGCAILTLLADIDNMDAKFAKRFIPGWKFSLEMIAATVLTSFFVIYEEYERNSFHVYVTCRKLFIACSVILGLQIHSFGIKFQQRFQAINAFLVKQSSVVKGAKFQSSNYAAETSKNHGFDVYDVFVGLVNIVHEFNRIFGWQILFLCGTFVLCILHVINLMIVVLNFNEWNEIKVDFWVVFISYLLTTLVLCIPFASSCNAAAEAAKTTSFLAYSLLAKQHKREGLFAESCKDLEILAGVPWPGFSAAGFFDVDHTMLFTLFGSVTSYLIVLIQLKDMRM